MPDNDEQLDATPVNPADAVLGVETKACVNGISKSDAEMVREIPEIKNDIRTINETTIPAINEEITIFYNEFDSVAEGLADQCFNLDTAIEDFSEITNKGFYLAPYTMTSTDFFEYRNSGYFAIRDIVIVTYFRSTSTQFGIKTVFLPKGAQMRDITGGYISIDTDNNTVTIYHGRISAASINNLVDISGHYSNYTFNIDTVDITNSAITHTTQSLRYYYNNQVDYPSISLYIRDEYHLRSE